jgi:hypothetical protein
MAVMYGRNGRCGRFPHNTVVETAPSLPPGEKRLGWTMTWVEKENSDWVSGFEGDGLQAVRRHSKIIAALAAEGQSFPGHKAIWVPYPFACFRRMTGTKLSHKPVLKGHGFSRVVSGR